MIINIIQVNDRTHPFDNFCRALQTMMDMKIILWCPGTDIHWVNRIPFWRRQKTIEESPKKKVCEWSENRIFLTKTLIETVVIQERFSNVYVETLKLYEKCFLYREDSVKHQAAPHLFWGLYQHFSGWSWFPGYHQRYLVQWGRNVEMGLSVNIGQTWFSWDESVLVEKRGNVRC